MHARNDASSHLRAWRPAACLIAVLCGGGLAGAVEPYVPDAEELAQFPLKPDLPGLPPATGVRYWHTPFAKLPLRGCYVSVAQHEADGLPVFELWQNTWGDGGPTDRQIIVQHGPALDRLAAPKTVCDGALIQDVPDPKNPAQLSPLRGYTRPAMTWDKEFGYVLMTCVCPDYLPGSVPLLPALLVSRSGCPGSFKYLGKIKGEPEAEAAKRTIWSDGGSLVRLRDGGWRLYLNGFGQVLAAAESKTLDGPWNFLRDERGAIRELFPEFPKAPQCGGCFPTVLRVAEDNRHAWITDTWPPQSIWHFWSPDGRQWRLYGQQPEITRAAFGGRGIKCLRAYVNPLSGEIAGLDKGPDGNKGWVLHASQMTSENRGNR